MGVSIKTGRELKCKVYSAIRDHCNVCKYTIQTSDFSVLSSGSSDYEIRISEGLLISRDSPCLNIHQQSDLHLFI